MSRSTVTKDILQLEDQLAVEREIGQPPKKKARTSAGTADGDYHPTATTSASVASSSASKSMTDDKKAKAQIKMIYDRYVH